MLIDLYEYSVKVIMFKVFSSICCPSVSQLFLRCNNAHTVCTRNAPYNFYVYSCHRLIIIIIIIIVYSFQWNQTYMQNNKMKSMIQAESLLQ
jgi:hypothetical protein